MNLDASQLLVSNSLHHRIHIADYLEFQKKHGMYKMDFFSHAPHLWLDHVQQPDTSELTRLLRQYNIEIEVLTPLSYKYSISSVKNTKQSEATYEYYCNCIKTADILGCRIVVVTIEGGCFDIDFSDQWRWAVEQLRLLCIEAEKQSIILALLPSYGKLSPIMTSLPEVVQMIEDVGSNSLNTVLDTQRISMTGESITQWVEALGNRIVLVRLADGNYNGARIWGEGSLPCRRYLEEIEDWGYTGPISLQVSSDIYAKEPFRAFERNLHYVRRQII